MSDVVASTYDHKASGGGGGGSGGPITYTKGETQAKKCRDPIFAVLFYVNVGIIAAVAGVFGPDAFGDTLSLTNTTSTDDTATGETATESLEFTDFSPFLFACLICGVFSFVTSFITLCVLMAIPTFLIKTSLIFTVVMAGLWAIFGLLSGTIIVGILGLVFFAITCCYAYTVWSRIPFASVNLETAITAVRANLGVTFVGYLVVILAFIWSLLWTVALLGIYNTVADCTSTPEGEVCDGSINGIYLFLLFISYFFVHQVLQNLLVVVVAGTVGTWWISPEQSGCCASSVTGSLCRASTTSFGSICFGSLLVAIIQALRQMANNARNGDDANAILLCLIDCILSCIESLIEYFNKWAYIYVGLYGYSYLEAGKNVITLFRDRGWEAIIADNLVGNTLFFVSVVVGALSGLVGLGLAATPLFDNVDDSVALFAGFFLGFLIGAVLTSILMSVIGAAVNSVIVLFAEAPAEFERHYPELSSKMRSIWSETFPGCLT